MSKRDVGNVEEELCVTEPSGVTIATAFMADVSLSNPVSGSSDSVLATESGAVVTKQVCRRYCCSCSSRRFYCRFR